MSGTRWTDDHFVGGHPALDLANTVFDRVEPAPRNELLQSADDLAGWLAAAGLAASGSDESRAALDQDDLLDVRRVRESIHAVLGSLARGEEPPAEQLGQLLTASGAAVEARQVDLSPGWREAGGIAGYLALLGVDAYFTLPRERIGTCPRCGWLFVDTSRSRQRRWCSMKTCGNRDKVARHRDLNRPADPRAR